jgi:hypothetical protein
MWRQLPAAGSRAVPWRSGADVIGGFRADVPNRPSSSRGNRHRVAIARHHRVPRPPTPAAGRVPTMRRGGRSKQPALGAIRLRPPRPAVNWRRLAGGRPKGPADDPSITRHWTYAFDKRQRMAHPHRARPAHPSGRRPVGAPIVAPAVGRTPTYSPCLARTSSGAESPGATWREGVPDTAGTCRRSWSAGAGTAVARRSPRHRGAIWSPHTRAVAWTSW